MVVQKSELDALQNAANVASMLLQKLADLGIPEIRKSLPPNVDSLIPDLILSTPDDILAPLSTLRIPSDLQRKILKRMDDFIVERQEQYKSSYRKSCLEVIRVTNSIAEIDNVHRAYQAWTQRTFLPEIRSQVSFIMTEVSKRQLPASETRQPFNNDFTPVLEKYFEINGYPSLLHRSILAQKSGMIPRQIEVWFQNHRNRAKKENLTVKRLDSEYSLRQALAILQQGPHSIEPRLPTPPIEQPTKSIQDSGSLSFLPETTVPRQSISKQPTLLDDSFTNRPPHAFPARKTDSLSDPFPSENGVFKFPAPIWRRNPATVPIPPIAVDIDEFAQTFHLKLNFSETQRRREFTPSKLECPSSQPWFTATTTLAPPAPLPALLRLPLVCRSILPSPTNIFSMPTFGSSSLTSLNLPPPGNDITTRKKRPLPRRLPRQSSSTPFESRASSFSSDTSSRSRVSSSMSNYSSPELPTPPALPNLDLPVVHDENQQQYLFDFSHIELDTHYPFANYLPSPDFNLTNTYSSSDKVTDIPFFDGPFPDFAHNLGEILS